MKRIKVLFTIGLVFIAVAVFGCSKKENKAAMDNTNQSVTDKTDSLEKSESPYQTEEKPISALYQDTSLPTEKRVENLLKQMTLEEKAGQMVQGAWYQVKKDEMRKLGLGSLLSGGGSYPGKNTIRDWADMIDGFQKSALESRLGIPMLYGVDAVHGHALVDGAVVYPHNIGLGAGNDPELVYKMGAAVAEELKLTKILWNFAPCVALSGDPRWGRTYECYSSDPEIAAALGEAYIKGQADHGVAPTAKHYIADGGTVFGTGEGSYLIDRGDVAMSEEELRSTCLIPYERAVKAGVKIIMASFSSYKGVKMHENKYLLTDVLKKELGFQGFIVSDWEAVSGLSGGSFEKNVILAVNAGVDMFMEPNRYKEAVFAIVNGVRNGAIEQGRVDDAVKRILTVKFDMGLFEDPYMKKAAHEVTELGSQQYRELAKQLVEKSLVLLKNENHVLPLKKGRKLYVTGPAMDDIGLQCGGWGHTWQGVLDRFHKKVTKGTTILEGLEEYGKKYGFEIITDQDRAKEADTVLLALGEVPYAEYEGDTEDLSITGVKAHPENASAIKAVKKLGKPTLALLVTGRNVIIKDYIKDWDGIVMCYLPGTEGEGVGAVLSGEAPFTGKLPMPYYNNVENIGKQNAEVLYDMGYGLCY